MHGSTVELPNELWLRVAQFIPDADLYRLASANHLFHDSAEDRMYRDLVLDDDCSEVLMRKLTKLQNDPATARRVRSLEIHPRAIRSACLKSQSQSQSVPQKTTKYHFFASCLHPSILTTLNLPFRPSRTHSPLEETTLYQTLLSALSNPHIHIESYTISWHSPFFLPDETAFCIPLLTSLWLAINAARNLRRLELDMRLEGVVELLQCIPSGLKFERLEMLVLGFNAENENEGFGVGHDILMPPLPLGLVVNDSNSSRRSPTTVLTPESNSAPPNSSPNASSNTPNTQTFLHLAEFILSLSDTLTSFTLSLPPSSTSIPRQRMIFFTL